MKVNKIMMKEAMENMPEVEDSLKGVVDPVMAKAKLDAEKNKKHFDEVVPSVDELDRKKGFLGAEKQPEPEEAEKELDSLEEEVIEDKAEAKKYLNKIVGNTKGYFTEKLVLSEDLFEDDQIENESEDLDESVPINELGVFSNKTSAGIKNDRKERNRYSKELKRAERVGDRKAAEKARNSRNNAAQNMQVKQRAIRLANVLREYPEAVSVAKEFSKYDAEKYVNRLSNISITRKALGDSSPEVIAQALEFIKQNIKNNGNKKPIKESAEEDLELGNKEALLREYNLEGALSSPEAKQKAIDKCNQILNILNNTEVEVTEIQEDDLEDDFIDGTEISDDSVDTEMTSTEDYYEESFNTHKHIHESLDDEVACEWCGEMTPVEELRNSDVGWICDYCINAIKSHGEPISIEYNSYYYDDPANCPDCIEEDYNLVGQDGNAFALMGYTANAMRECGIADEIGEMRERAMSSDYNNLLVVCNEYIQKCNELVDRFDDDYVVEGLEFAADTSEIMEDVDEFPLPEVGQKIRIIKMEGEPHYDGKEGVIDHIDALKQLHGSWGGLAVIPGVDEFEVIE